MATTGSEEFDAMLAKIAFRAMTSRDADKLRELTLNMDPHARRKAVRTASDIFAHTVLCSVSELAGMGGDRGRRLTESRPDTVAKVLAGEKVKAAGEKARKEHLAKSSSAGGGIFGWRRKKQDNKVREMADIGAEIDAGLAELRGLSTAFLSMAATHRKAVLEVCDEALKTAGPTLNIIEEQFARGVQTATASITTSALKIAALAEESENLSDVSSRSVVKSAAEILRLTDSVGMATKEANLQAHNAVGIMTGKVNKKDGFNKMVEENRNAKNIIPRKRSDGSRIRAAGMLNTVDARSAEVASIVSTFDSDLDHAMTKTKASADNMLTNGQPKEVNKKRTKG